MWAASSWRKLKVSLLRTFKRTTGSVLDEFSRRSAQRLFESDITHVQRANEKPSEFDSTAVCLWFVHRLKESLTPSLWLLLWRIYEQKKINNTLMILLENPHRPFLFKKLEHTCCVLWWNVNKQPPNLWTSLLGTDITLQDSGSLKGHGFLRWLHTLPCTEGSLADPLKWFAQQPPLCEPSALTFRYHAAGCVLLWQGSSAFIPASMPLPLPPCSPVVLTFLFCVSAGEVWLPQTADPPRVCAGPQIPSVPSYIAAAFSFSRSQLRI